MRRLFVICILAVLISVSAANANVTYGFKHIIEPEDGPTELADGIIGQSQLSMNVSDAGAGQVLFVFSNAGPDPSSITDVYFDDSDIMAALISIDNSDPGVSFSQYAKPAHLPAGNYLTPPFVVTSGFSADSDSPVQLNGVNPGESLGINFSLQTGRTFNDVISGLDSGALRVGLKVQGFAGGNSETFVNTAVIPAPGAIVLGSIGAAVVGWLRRHRTL